jgi:predicted secreted hydrolase
MRSSAGSAGWRARILLAWLFAAAVPAGVCLSAAQATRAESGKPRFDVAKPGYRYQFPRDHFSHPNFQTEWWYYTGNLRTAAGRRFGFELTFFRQGLARPAERANSWVIDDLYLAHFAVTDVEGKRFLHTERLNRAGPGIAGASAETGRIWNGNWEVRWDGESQRLRAVAEGFSADLTLTPRKPPVIHGKDGISRKAAGEGRASHYISFTRMETAGALVIDGQGHEVTGLSWMDHEFFTHQLEDEQAGWDWFSIQLEDGSDLMLFRLRRKDGSPDPFSAGTYVDPQGRSRHLSAAEFVLEPAGATWLSPKTGARYPTRWNVRVPSLGLELTASTPLESQELSGPKRLTPTYWEGLIDLTGTREGKTIRGTGYLEMTGYDRPVDFGR